MFHRTGNGHGNCFTGLEMVSQDLICFTGLEFVSQDWNHRPGRIHAGPTADGVGVSREIFIKLTTVFKNSKLS